jgi:RND family efflux transporter MFP subunit
MEQAMRLLAQTSSITAFIAGALLLAGCNAETAERVQEAKPRPVLVSKVVFAPQVPKHSLPGTIRARIEGDIGFRIGGKLARRLVDVGQTVQEGQTLALLDAADLTLQKDQAAAELAAAKSTLATAEDAFKRILALRQSGWSTQADFDQKRSAQDEAQGRFLRAQRALSLADRSLDYATLRADAAGVVTAVLAEPGQVVASGQTILRLARPDEKEAVIAVPEQMLTHFVPGGAAIVTLWAVPGKRYSATLRELAPIADTTTRTYAARFSIPQAGPEVQLGLTASVEIVQAAMQVARIPLSAVFDEGKGPQVWVFDPAKGSLAEKPVEIAAYDTQSAIIKNGLDDGDYVVTLGVHKLDTAMKVRPVFSPAS